MNFSNIVQHPKTTVAGFLAALIVAGGVAQQVDWSKPLTPGAWIGFVVALATALLGAFFKDPVNKAASMLLFVLLMPTLVMAQSSSNDAALPVPPISTVNQGLQADVVNLYGVGASYNNGASASVAGTALYARKIADSSTYAFTVVDAVPNTLKPFTVNTNIGAGIAQKIFAIGRVPIFIPTSAGISFNGQNTGWKYDFGALAAIHLKGQYYLLPTVRVVKSSVSNGDGYQPIVGVLFGWGQ
jgi:hypothetical protein